MEEAVTWYERLGPPIFDFLIQLGAFTAKNPFIVLGFLLVLLVVSIILKIVLKLAPIIIVISLILLLFAGGLGASVWNFFFSDARTDHAFEIDFSKKIELSEQANELLSEQHRHEEIISAYPYGSTESIASVSDECAQARLPEKFHTYREGILRLHTAAIYCPHEVMFMFLSGLGTDRSETEWIDVAGEVTSTSVALDTRVFMDLPNYFVLQSALEKLYDAKRAYTTERSLWSSFKEMVRIENAPQGILIHTHPAHQLGMIAMPPSLADVMMSSGMQNFVQFEVVDPTGIWSWRGPDRLNVLALGQSGDGAGISDADIELFEQLLDIDSELAAAKKEGRYTETVGATLMSRRESVLRELDVVLTYQPLGRWFDI